MSTKFSNNMTLSNIFIDPRIIILKRFSEISLQKYVKNTECFVLFCFNCKAIKVKKKSHINQQMYITQKLCSFLNVKIFHFM